MSFDKTAMQVNPLGLSASTAISRSVFPIVGPDDDLTTPLEPNATAWQKFTHSPVTQRSGRVLLTLVIGAVVLAVINLTMVPRKMTCVTPDDCRQIRRINTVVVGVRSLLTLVISFILVFVVLHEAGVDTKALLATAGIVGIVVGLAAQPTIKSFIAGVTYVCTDQFSIGDFVSLDLDGAATAKGVVQDFSTQTTTLQNLAGGNLYIPNANIKVVINYSQNEQRAQVDVHVSHKGDIDVVLHEIQALNAVMATAQALKGKMTRPPVLKGVTKNGKYSYTVAVSAIAEPMAQLFVERYMRYQLLRLMQRIGVHASATTLTPDATSKYASANVILPPAPPPPPAQHTQPLPYNPINVETASRFRPETERGDMSVLNPVPVTVAEMLRHDADVVHDGHMYRHITLPSSNYGSAMGIDVSNVGETI